MNMNIILEFYNNTTPEEKKQLLNMMARDIIIPYRKKDGIHDYELCDENPVSMNGTAFQLNTKEFSKHCNS